MAKQPAKAAERLKDNETLNGSNALPAKIQFGPDKSVALGEIVVKAHQASGLSVDAWNALPEAKREELLIKMIDQLRPIAEAAAVDQTLDEALADRAALLAAIDGQPGIPILKPIEDLEFVSSPASTQMMVSERVYIISAPGGPRRRAGLSFGPVPVELTYDQLGDDPDETLEALCADPFLKIDGRYEERPAESD